jgi:hypothetical protein
VSSFARPSRLFRVGSHQGRSRPTRRGALQPKDSSLGSRVLVVQKPAEEVVQEAGRAIAVGDLVSAEPVDLRFRA